MPFTLAEQIKIFNGIGRNPDALDALVNPYVSIPDATTYTVLAQNTNKIHLVPDFTATCAVTLPAILDGLVFRFIYAGVAADAQNNTFGSTPTFMKGNIEFADLDAGAGADEMSTVFANGTSHVTMTITTPASYDVTFVAVGTLWQVHGRVLSNTACAFS